MADWRLATGDWRLEVGVARVDITMTQDEMEAFLAAERTLIVSTIGRDGSPHVAPMWYFLYDERIVFRSFTKSQKIVNLRRDPRLTVLVESGIAYAELKGVMIEGTARLIDGDDDPAFVLEAYRRLAAMYSMVGPKPVDLDPEALEATFGRFAPKNTAVIVEPRRVVTWDHTKLGGRY
jgi:PPOX class probable F420-dependent enzyme